MGGTLAGGQYHKAALPHVTLSVEPPLFPGVMFNLLFDYYIGVIRFVQYNTGLIAPSQTEADSPR